MTKDPRHQNIMFDDTSIGSYMKQYADTLSHVISAIDPEALQRAADIIVGAGANGKRIFVAGNGGSAAIAEHLCCDWTKGTQCDGHPSIITQSLTSNVALYSAVANDFGFDNVFSKQINLIGSEGDVLVAVSSSGNSANIVYAADVARQKGMTVIGFAGFSGGKLASRCDVLLHANADNYGIVEDAHQALTHILAQYIAKKRDTSNPAFV